MSQKQQPRKQSEGRKRGTITSKGTGVWLVRVFVGSRMVDGKRVKQYSSKVVRGTYRQADQERTRMLCELDKGTFVAPSKQQLAEYLENWLKGSVSSTVSTRTQRGYRFLLEKYVIPVIGTVPLDRLHPADIQALYNGMSAQGRSPRTVQYTHRVLKAALGQAVLWRQLRYNPTDNLKLPQSEKKDVRVLTAAEVAKIIKETEGDHHYALWVLLLHTGLRPQEALALKWTDLDGDKLSIERALVQITAGKYEIGPTKTKTSRRRITVPQSALRPLMAHKARQAEDILKAGAGYERNGFIFTTKMGKTLSVTNVSRSWRRTMQRLKMGAYTLYSCRHTHISLLLDAGWSVKAVSERAGHASAKMTLDVYCHTMPETDSETAAKFDELLLRAASQ